MTETAVHKTTRGKRGTKPKVALPEAEGPELERRKLSRADYHRAAELGIFGPDERLELIHGEVYRKMSPQSSAHAMAIRAVATALEEAFGEGVDVRQQLPVHTDDSEPEPDVAVVPGSWQDYKNHPSADVALLIVEIADTSVRGDRGLKAALYAEAGVRDYWIVNLNARAVEVYREPAALASTPHGFGFKSVRLYTEDETVSPLAKPEAAIPVARLLPAL